MGNNKDWHVAVMMKIATVMWSDQSVSYFPEKYENVQKWAEVQVTMYLL